MTLERRISRAERLLKMFARSGRKYRNEFRDTLNILIHMQVRDKEEYLARQRKLDEKIDILIATQTATEEQMKQTDKRIEAWAARTETLGARTETLGARTETLGARTEALAERTEVLAERTEALAVRTEALAERTETLAATTETLAERTETLAERTEVWAERTEVWAVRTEAWAAKTSENLDRLTASQAKTDKALERFLDGLNKGRNGSSTD
jgi:uncharacterized protein (DUF3084 family)